MTTDESILAALGNEIERVTEQLGRVRGEGTLLCKALENLEAENARLRQALEQIVNADAIEMRPLAWGIGGAFHQCQDWAKQALASAGLAEDSE